MLVKCNKIDNNDNNDNNNNNNNISRSTNNKNKPCRVWISSFAIRNLLTEFYNLLVYFLFMRIQI